MVRLGNEKGEVITIGIVTAAILIGILGFVVGASGVRKFIPGFGGKDNKTVQTSVSKVESKPIIVTGADGKPYILQATKTEMSNSDLSEEQKMSWIQRLLFLPKLWLLLMILGIFFPPIAAFMAMINKKLMGETKKIVNGVEAGLTSLEDKSLSPQLITKLQMGVALTPDEVTVVLDHTKAKTKILDTLSKKFDASTKLLVAKIKQEV